MIQNFTGWQYLLIDLANAFGLDKKTFDQRVDWAKDHLSQLESLIEQADSKPLFVKAMMAVRKAQQGVPTGHLVGFDAVCSGMQLMAVVTGCRAAAVATGLIDSGQRPDAYTAVTQEMNSILGGMGVNVKRDDAKTATMTSLYGSKAEPVKIFGEGTEELKAFYQAMNVVAPGPWALLQVLLNSWQSYALSHDWTLPDGFEARVKVTDKVETRIEVDELDHTTFTYQYKENMGLPIGHVKSKSNAANVVHSIDAYVLRSVHRRCNYDEPVVSMAASIISDELMIREAGWKLDPAVGAALQDKPLQRYISLWQATGMADAVILPHLSRSNSSFLPRKLLIQLQALCESMLAHKPFEVITIHDEFKAHPNHMNQLRSHYREILAELADSSLLDHILSQIHKRPVSFPKLSSNLSRDIRQSNYALC
jgi:hypothetical protein